MEETAEALEQIVRQGKALYVGISNYSPKQTAQMEGILRDKGLHCLIHQLRFSMLDQENLPAIREAERLSIGTIAFCPLAQGLLTDKYLNGIPEDSRAAGHSRFFGKEQITEEALARVRALNALAGQRGQSLAQMALAWNLGRNTSVILGASRIEQLQEKVRALDNLDFTEEETARIEEILK